jgi:hypothetical protein
MARTIIAALASLIEARANCQRTGNAEWFQRHTARIARIELDLLPRGSGIDMGATVDLDKSTGERVVIRVPFHRMSPNGYYVGWCDYTVTVTPTFSGFHTRVTGRDYNDLKSYLGDLFAEVLARPMPEETIAVA